MIAMVVTLAAAGYVSFVFYQDKVERKFDKAASLCALCTTGKQVAQTNWDSVQSHLEQLKSQKRNKRRKNSRKHMPARSPMTLPARIATCLGRITTRRARLRRWD